MTDQVASITTIDLFCGIGGLTLGMQRAGFDCLVGVDHWADAVETFKHNLPGVPCLQADITKLTLTQLEKAAGQPLNAVDLVVGGPPCQGFSTVGKRDHEDPRNSLWRHFTRVVDGVRPRFVMIENVEGLVVSNRGSIREQIHASFEDMGYSVKSQLLKAADFGVPQLRKRVFFLAWDQGEPEPAWPEPTTPEHITVADAIFDLPELGPGQKATEYGGRSSTEYQRARRNGCRVLRNHQAANHPEHLVEIIRHIPDGGNRQSVPDHLQPKSGFHNSYARLASWKPAIAVTSNMRKPSSARATHPNQHRGLTVREGLRLQSFDDSFVPQGSRTSQYLQVGNAVPPLLAEAVGRQLMVAATSGRPHLRPQTAEAIHDRGRAAVGN